MGWQHSEMRLLGKDVIPEGTLSLTTEEAFDNYSTGPYYRLPAELQGKGHLLVRVRGKRRGRQMVVVWRDDSALEAWVSKDAERKLSKGGGSKEIDLRAPHWWETLLALEILYRAIAICVPGTVAATAAAALTHGSAQTDSFWAALALAILATVFTLMTLVRDR